MPEVVDLATGAANGAHAEGMRLERIEVIASDPGADADVRDVFRRILPRSASTSAPSAASPRTPR